MEKLWLDSEDGRDAVGELTSVPNARRVLLEAGYKHSQGLVNKILSSKVNTPEKDRELIVAKAEYDGAQAMLKSILSLFEEASRQRK